jgi:HEAT repeat protein
MTRRQKLVVGFTACAVLAGASIWYFNPSPSFPDPVFKGKPVSEWAREQAINDNWEATGTLREIGSTAVPHLVPYLDKGDSIFNEAYVKIWQRLPQFAQKRLPTAARARDMRMNTVVALREMGSPASNAVPALIERLSDQDGSISLHSAIALGNIGPPAAPAVPALLPLLSSGSYNLRIYTACALWKIESNAPTVLPVLEAALKDESASFRWATAVFLGEMGPAASNAIPSLRAVARSTNLEVASCAVQALAAISPETVPALIELLDHPDAGMRNSACVALGNLGAAASEAVPALKDRLADHEMGAPTIMGRPAARKRVGDEAAAALSKIESK